jgi:hypothetical protein
VSNLRIKNKKFKWWGARTVCETARARINIVHGTHLTSCLCCISCCYPMVLLGGGGAPGHVLNPSRLRLWPLARRVVGWEERRVRGEEKGHIRHIPANEKC